MPLLGNPLAAAFSTINKQTITGNGTVGPYTLDYSAGSDQDIEVFVNNVRQEPGVAYTVAGTSLTMTGTVASSDDFYVVFQGKAQQTVTASAESISNKNNTSTGYFAIPAGTTAQRPASPANGHVRLNTTIGSFEFYNNGNWSQTNYVPTINSVTGSIIAGTSSNLTVNVTNATDTMDIVYKEGATTLATTSAVAFTSGSATTAVPAAVYGQSGGDTITISVIDNLGVPSSNSVNKTVAVEATGGTITRSGGKTIHTFTSSGTFTIPSGSTFSCDILVVAGGGGGNHAGGGGGGGGAGGFRKFTSQSLAAGARTVTIGAGGSSQPGAGYVTPINPGNDTKFDDGGAGELAATGGGAGKSDSTSPASTNGGSGGGGSGGHITNGGTGNAGGYTPSEGNNGGNASGTPYAAGGGGGAGAVGGNGAAPTGGTGGVGTSDSITGSAVFYAGGGGGGGNGGSNAAGGNGGGGTGSGSYTTNGGDGTANTGGGGGGQGGGGNGGQSGAGGSGVVIISYTP